MIIELDSFEGNLKRFDIEVAGDSVELDVDHARLFAPVRFAGQIYREGSEVDVEGRVEALMEIECARCLQPVQTPLRIEFKVRFLGEKDFEKSEHEVSGDELDADLLKGDRIDLTDIIREQLLLNLPESLFCRLDCQGLCEKCGANRNLIDCNCIENEIDPRWAALKNLK